MLLILLGEMKMARNVAEIDLGIGFEGTVISMAAIE